MNIDCGHKCIWKIYQYDEIQDQSQCCICWAVHDYDEMCIRCKIRYNEFANRL
jgi:hypothetical protein